MASSEPSRSRLRRLHKGPDRRVQNLQTWEAHLRRDSPKTRSHHPQVQLRLTQVSRCRPGRLGPPAHRSRPPARARPPCGRSSTGCSRRHQTWHLTTTADRCTMATSPITPRRTRWSLARPPSITRYGQALALEPRDQLVPFSRAMGRGGLLWLGSEVTHSATAVPGAGSKRRGGGQARLSRRPSAARLLGVYSARLCIAP